MRTGTWIVAALLLATSSAIAADPQQEDAHKSAAELAREKMEKRRASSKSAARPSTAKQPEITSDRVAAGRAKSVYMYAVESCAEAPARCDAALREDAERRFMDACNVCAPAERCEAERDAIKDGSAKRSSNPCVATK